MSLAAPPASTNEALEMLTSAMSYLANADPTQMGAEEQARCLATLEEVDAMETAARASVLGGFSAGKGHWDDAAYSPRSWLIHQTRITRITRGAAAGHIAWVRRACAHPRMVAALAAGQMSESWARILCGWTDKLPEDCRDKADEILAGAACQGMALRDLAALAAEMQSRADPGDGDDVQGKVFEDRAVRLETTFQGAGVLSGDLTPECAAVLTTVLGALSAPRGAADTRSHAQRYHDALEEAARRLVTAGLLPERAGQPAKVITHISLADLIDLDAGSVLQDKWAEQARAQWAAHRAAASVSGSDGGAWLEGDAARGFACDASITPVVMGEVNPAVLDDLVRLCAELAGYGPGHRGHHSHDDVLHEDGPTADSPGEESPGDTTPQTSALPTSPAPVPPTPRGRDALERKIIGKAVALLSGPGGLASFLRRQQLGGRLAGPSLPLDVGSAGTSRPRSARR